MSELQKTVVEKKHKPRHQNCETQPLETGEFLFEDNKSAEQKNHRTQLSDSLSERRRCVDQSDDIQHVVARESGKTDGEKCPRTPVQLRDGRKTAGYS